MHVFSFGNGISSSLTNVGHKALHSLEQMLRDNPPPCMDTIYSMCVTNYLYSSPSPTQLTQIC